MLITTTLINNYYTNLYYWLFPHNIKEKYRAGLGIQGETIQIKMFADNIFLFDKKIELKGLNCMDDKNYNIKVNKRKQR